MARGMRGGMDPRMMKKLQKQMKPEEMEVTEVIFRMKGRDLVFKHPSVTAISLMGQNTYQVMGDPVEVISGASPAGGHGEGSSLPAGTPPSETPAPTGPAIPEEDIKLVAQQAGVTPSEARAALIKVNGDIAEAIISLM